MINMFLGCPTHCDPKMNFFLYRILDVELTGSLRYNQDAVILLYLIILIDYQEQQQLAKVSGFHLPFPDLSPFIGLCIVLFASSNFSLVANSCSTY